MKNKFKINNDLNHLDYNYHNMGHTIGNIILTILYGPLISYILWFIWEIWDGFKPWYYDAPKKIRNAKFPSINWIKNNILYSDKFSLQDIFVWNLLGCIIGYMVKLWVF